MVVERQPQLMRKPSLGLHPTNSRQTSLQAVSKPLTVLSPSRMMKIALAISLLFPACLLAEPGPDGYPIIHISYSNTDQWAQCIRNITGKPLVIDFEGWNFLECPTSAGELNAQLERKGVLVRGGKWDLLIGKTYLSPGETPPEYWQNAVVNVEVRSWVEDIPGSRHPTEADLKELGQKALEVIRSSLPVITPISSTKEAVSERSGNRTATIDLELLFDIHRLIANGPETIIGIFRQARLFPSGRLIYGEYRNGKPVFLWDSPAFSTRFLSLAYRDVNGDGTQEILLRSESACRTSCNYLTIFTSRGEELSRQVIRDDGFLCVEGSACPISGGQFLFISQGARIPNRIEVQWPEDHQPNDVYTMESSNTFRQQARAATRGKNNN